MEFIRNAYNASYTLMLLQLFSNDLAASFLIVVDRSSMNTLNSLLAMLPDELMNFKKFPSMNCFSILIGIYIHSFYFSSLESFSSST